MGIEQQRISQFHEMLFSWWADNKRQFPWRDTTDPYKIMVSEFMLQQTQAIRVIPKFLLFTEKYPDLQTLSEADKKELLTIWSGLGYNRRAIWLQQAAGELLKFEPFPQDPVVLRKLRGVGSYTSRAIPIFAFNADLVTVDTNIRRILIYEGFAQEESSERELYEIAENLLPMGKSRDYHSALMDYGALSKTSKVTKISSINKHAPFKGSTRDFRGKIIKCLTKRKGLSRRDLQEKCSIPGNEIIKILQGLIDDELIQYKSGRYYI
ncbi:MAG: Fe-S cluster assembly protein HesB [Candidatus Kariarchaeaceae archaeon]|jgi:A/G-specific adenine glycosylase